MKKLIGYSFVPQNCSVDLKTLPIREIGEIDQTSMKSV